MIRILGTIFAGLLGLAFGSFLNVCLSRWPEGESIVKPRSHCRSCRRTLSWWENVPLASWIALRGRCRTCSARISFRYPLVEAAMGATWLLIAPQISTVALTSTRTAAVWFAVFAGLVQMVEFWILIALAVLDAEYLWLPDWLTYSGIVVGLGANLATWIFLSDLSSAIKPSALNLVNPLLAAIIAAGIVLVIRWAYWLVRRKEGIGLGDAKLMAMLGAWLGFSGALLAFVIGVVLGALAAISLLILPKRHESAWAMSRLPLGTFLCIGGIVSSLWGRQIISAYMHWAGF